MGLIRWIKRMFSVRKPTFWFALDPMHDQKFVVDLWPKKQKEEDNAQDSVS